MPQFSHLHCHTQYSILDGAANIGQMVKKAAADGMPAVAITDHGNMFGVYEFVNTCNKEKVKPIVGCEFYMVQDMSIRSFAGAGIRDRRYHQLLLAKNPEGYQNLTRLTSMAYKDGLYGKFPRIDMELLKKNKNGLIATTCCIGGIVPQTILEKGVEAGEVVFKEWLDLFGEDYYIELQRHNLTNINGTTWSQEGLNQVLLNWSEKYNVPAIATNDSHYVDQEDSEMHDILLCINTGAKKSQPKKSDDEDGTNKDTRFGFANDQFFFKTSSEMEKLFHDAPQALENTQIIVDKIELLDLKKEIMMPNFVVPTGFDKQSDYMRHLVYEGAKKRYKEITSEISERIELELNTIFTAKYEGYFLVIEDFLTVARKLDVSVGRQPVVVVDHDRVAGPVAKGQKLRKDLLDAVQVRLDGFIGQLRPRGVLARGVPDLGRAAAHKDDGLVTGLLEPAQHHDLDQAADVERGGRRVETDVGRDHPGIGRRVQLRRMGDLVNVATRLECLEKVGLEGGFGHG
jgi:DNA polymerase-3 subunit alpha